MHEPIPPMAVPPPHPVAAIFPMMSREQLQDLADDIRRNGQRLPIVVFQRQTLDGRNRAAACALAGVEPKIQILSKCDSPTDFIMSMNEKRRQMTPVQLAALAVDPVMLESRKAEAKAKQTAGQDAGRANRGRANLVPCESPRKPSAERTDGEAVSVSAKALGVGRDSAYMMQRIQRADPEVYEAARRGEIATVAEAARQAGVPPRYPASDSTASLPLAPAPSRDPRVIRRDARDEEIRALHESESLGTKEIAKRLGVSKSSVSDAKARLGINQKLDTNPLRGLTDFATEAADTIEIAISNPSQLTSATPEQVEELDNQLRELRRKTSTLINMLSEKK